MVIASGILAGAAADNTVGAALFHQQAGAAAQAVEVTEATAWGVNSIWTTPEALLK